MKGLRLIVATVLMALLPAVAAHAYPARPDEDFRTLHTAHFRISYPVQHRLVALQVAVIAEEAFEILTQRLKYEPHTPSDIVITDRTDGANGLSAILPVQVIRLFLAPPYTSDRLDYYDDYLRLLIYHEMTHAIHTDEVRGIPKVLRYLFGRTLPITRLQPQGFVEGIAVFNETDLTTKGRLRSPYTHMMLRMAAVDGNWPPLDQITLTRDEWPGGAVPYLWGGMFHQHLADRYGVEKIADYYMKHAGQIWPFLFDHNARVIFGTHVSDLYEAWSVNQIARLKEEAAAIAAKGLTPSTPVTTSGETHASPTWLDENRLAFYEAERHRTPALRTVDLRQPSRRPRTLTTTYGVRGLAAQPDGGVVFAQNRPTDRWRAYFDLWRQDPGRLLPRRLTTDSRVADPAWIPGTERVVAVTQEGGRTALVEIDLGTGARTPLTTFEQFEGYVQFARPAVHPGGQWLAVSVWHSDGRRDLFKFDLATRSLTRLTSHAGRDVDPTFDPTGRYLLFSSARDGIYNLYALDLQTDALFQVTNVVGGAFEPSVDPSGKRLAFINYGGAGFDVHVTDFDPTRWRRVAREAIAGEGVEYGPISRDIRRRAQEIDPPTDDYQAYRTAWPHYWLPAFSLAAGDFWLGAETAGFDVAGYHSWAARAMWGFERQFPFAAAAYTYSRFTPAVAVSAAHSAERHGEIVLDDDGRPAHYWERRVTGQLTVTYPLLWRHSFYLGYLGQSRTDLDDVPDFSPEVPFTGYWSGLRAGWYYDLAGSGRYLSFPLGFGATVFDPALGSDITQQLLGGQAGMRVPLGVEHLSWFVDTMGAVSFGDLLPQRSFRLGGYAASNPMFVSYQNDRFGLRGYESGTANGDLVATSSTELAFPIAKIERGFQTWPFYLRDITGAAFGEAGFAIDREQRLLEDDVYPSTGLELYFDAVVAYSFAARLRSSVAYGFRDRDNRGGFQWLVTFGGLLP